MKIWAHTLVKNEEKWLWFAVTSIINHVEKVLLWDTGSTDGTVNIIEELRSRYPNKISFKEAGEVNTESFEKVRQEMLDETHADWFIVLDGDEIWWEESIIKVIKNITDTSGKSANKFESVVVPTINLVGDIFHYQEEKAGRYKFGDRVGHYNLRAVKRDIPGLQSKGRHGIWGWADDKGRQIQERNTFKFIETPYLHASFLPRAGQNEEDLKVTKRPKKLKYELGIPLPLDYYFPEAFFKPKPDFIPSPWVVTGSGFYRRALIETPLRSLKRRLIHGKVGY